MRQPKVKTKEQILKANLAKTLNRMKTKVADREGLWLEFFQDTLSFTLGYYFEHDRKGDAKDCVLEASNLADCFLDSYETRWGTS